MSSNEACTRIDVLRHGQCEGGHIFRGSNDVALLPEGHAAMHASCETVLSSATRPWDVVLTSPLSRCLSFARPLAERHLLSLEVVDDLREMSFGAWEGREILAVMQEDAERMCAWGDDPVRNSPPEGEALHEFSARVQEVYEHVLNAYRGKHVLLVTHGGVLRVLFALMLGLPLNKIQGIDAPYACISRFAVFHTETGDIPKLLTHNAQPS